MIWRATDSFVPERSQRGSEGFRRLGHATTSITRRITKPRQTYQGFCGNYNFDVRQRNFDGIGSDFGVFL